MISQNFQGKWHKVLSFKNQMYLNLKTHCTGSTEGVDGADRCHNYRYPRRGACGGGMTAGTAADRYGQRRLMGNGTGRVTKKKPYRQAGAVRTTWKRIHLNLNNIIGMDIQRPVHIYIHIIHILAPRYIYI